MKQFRHKVKEVFGSLAYLVKGLDHDGIDLYFTKSPDIMHGHRRGPMLAKLNSIDYLGGKTNMEATLCRVWRVAITNAGVPLL
jgi:hypothetical protein